MEESRDYLLVTACKNEAENLPSLIKSIIEQTILPVVWVIVDDGSTDETPWIIGDAIKKYNWIHVLQLEESKRDLGLHYAHVINMGFEHAISYCGEKEMEYSYLGNLDADLILVPTFFEYLINEFVNDSKLGIASGDTEHLINNIRVRHNTAESEPCGGHMLIRRTCFEELGGIPLSYSIDSVMKAKARIRNWNTRRFKENVATEIRDVCAAEGHWKGLVHKGESAYYLNVNPLHIVLLSIKYLFITPHYYGFPLLVGYLGSVVSRKNQIDDEEIRHYFWNKWKYIIQSKLIGGLHEAFK